MKQQVEGSVVVDQAEISRVTRIVRRLVPRHIDAEDIAIDIVVKSWSSGVEHTPYGFIRMRVYSRMRTVRRDQERMLKAYREKPPVSSDDQLDASSVVERAMQVLTRRQKEAILYYFFIELTMTEIAKRMKISTSAVSLLINHGLEKMRKEFKNDQAAQSIPIKPDYAAAV